MIMYNVEALVQHIQEILLSFGVSDSKAIQVYGDHLAAGKTLLAAYVAAIKVAEDALKQSTQAVQAVEHLTL